MTSETITVYWATPMLNDKESWIHFYPSPINVMNHYRKIQNLDAKVGTMFSCPAVTDTFKNVFMFQHPFANEIELPNGNSVAEIELKHGERAHMGVTSMISLYKERQESFKGYINYSYNLYWFLFADEPVVARFTAPYFPPVSPAEGVLFATGEYDIGSWFRKMYPDYHVPVQTKKLTFKENDPIFFVELKTDKKVVFKRFLVTDKLAELAYECGTAPSRYGWFKPLSYRYEKARQAQMPEIVLSEIKKNLID